ncbi:MAG: YceI family protein [Candidatus Eisenbacteria bacterium]|nr:YceI family protein [Candidatus Eisenbacteria bacterium]
MKAQSRTLALVAVFALIPGLAGAAEWEIDRAHSGIAFTIRHLGISNVKGMFTDFTGSVAFDEEKLEGGSVSIRVKAGSVDTQNEKRDEHLRGADFFDVANYPEIVFTSTGVAKSEEGHVLRGMLRILDMERPVEIPFEYLGSIQDPWGGTRAGFEGRLKLTREEFGVGWKDTKYRPPLIANEVVLTFSLELIKKAG